MLAARDQENRIFGRSVGGAAGKAHALGPKTPGGKNPNTPLKIPLNDANGTVRMAGAKSVLGGRPGGNENLRTIGKAGKSNLVTPLEPRTTRAPLGNKTTNAKAHALQQQQTIQQQKARGGVKAIVQEIEKSQQQLQQQPAPTGRRAKASTPRTGNASKLSVLSDGTTATSNRRAGDDDDIEYAPPRVPARPYESDVFPDGVLTFAAFRPENRLRGYYDYYYQPVDEDGVPLRDKALAEQQRRAFEKLDICVQEDLDALDWSIGDVPASKDYLANQRKQKLQLNQPTALSTAPPPPPTIASRKAASALALAPKSSKPLRQAPSTAVRAKPAPPAVAANASSASAATTSLLSGLPLRKPRMAPSALPLRPKSGASNPPAETASRTTLGYNKGRTALSLVRETAGRPGGDGAPVARRATPAASTDRSPAAATPGPRAPRSLERLNDMAAGDLGGPAEPKSPAFLSIFEIGDEQDSMGGAGTFVNDDLDDDFQMDVQF